MHSIASQIEDEQRREQEVAEAILQYLAENPDASDTMEGIAEWWIMRQRLRVEVNLLAKVLRRLTAAGILEQEGAADNPRYHLKTQKKIS